MSWTGLSAVSDAKSGTFYSPIIRHLAVLLAAAQKFLKGFAIKPYNFFSAAVQVGQKQKRFSIKLFIAGREFTCVNIVTSTSGFPTGSFGYSKWQNRYKYDLFVTCARRRRPRSPARAARDFFGIYALFGYSIGRILA